MSAMITRAVRMIVSSRRRRRAAWAILVTFLVAAMPVVNAACALDTNLLHGADVVSAPAHQAHDSGTSHDDPCCETVGPQIIESIKPVVHPDALSFASVVPHATYALGPPKWRASDPFASRLRVSPAPPEPVLRRVPRLLI